jgi:hypothetical protein
MTAPLPDELTSAAVPVLVEVFGCDEATAWNALHPPNGALGPALAALFTAEELDSLMFLAGDDTKHYWYTDGRSARSKLEALRRLATSRSPNRPGS